MKYQKIFLLAFVVFAHAVSVYAAPAKCSKQNLTRCLDSACAINIGANPAARCQYCGTSDAGLPPTGKKAMKSVTAGKSSKNIISEKELKNAPSDAGKRYMWASTECLKKLPDCTAEDITDTYDKLIEQSCTAAGIAMKMTTANETIQSKPSKSKCQSSITKCVNDKCGISYDQCPGDSDFDRVISECSTENTGCEEYLAELRKDIGNSRSKSFASHDQAINDLAKMYQDNRNTRLSSIQSSCKNNGAVNQCVEKICKTNMIGQCKKPDEKVMANSLCKFYATACETVKNMQSAAKSDKTIADKTSKI